MPPPERACALRMLNTTSCLRARATPSCTPSDSANSSSCTAFLRFSSVRLIRRSLLPASAFSSSSGRPRGLLRAALPPPWPGEPPCGRWPRSWRRRRPRPSRSLRSLRRSLALPDWPLPFWPPSRASTGARLPSPAASPAARAGAGLVAEGSGRSMTGVDASAGAGAGAAAGAGAGAGADAGAGAAASSIGAVLFSALAASTVAAADLRGARVRGGVSADRGSARLASVDSWLSISDTGRPRGAPSGQAAGKSEGGRTSVARYAREGRADRPDGRAKESSIPRAAP